jgi:hypothetical protein
MLKGEDPNSNYTIDSSNFNLTFNIPQIVEAIYMGAPVALRCASFPNPLPMVIPKDSVFTTFVPFPKLVAHSYLQAVTLQGSTFDAQTLNSALQAVFSELTVESWTWYFDAWLRDKTASKTSANKMSIFAGAAPYTNDCLKCTANIGSQFFDTITAVLAGFYRVGISKKAQSEAAPNDTLKHLYEQVIVNYGTAKAECISRHWNNKGNSMETLMFVMYEESYHALVWFTGYICVNYSYQKSGCVHISAV